MMRLSTALTLSLTVFMGPLAAAQSPSDVLDEVFSSWDRDDGPGLAVAAIFDGRIIYERGFGLANVEQGTPITPKTIFRIGSTSKQFTALCVALLSQRGELDLDADIRTWLVELSAELPLVTVRDMVHHTSGLPDYIDLHIEDGLGEGTHLTPADTLQRLALVTELRFPVGARWEYSNTNYFLLGEIVWRVSGLSLREFAAQNIFEPLGMHDSHFHDNAAELVLGRADGYASPVGHHGNGQSWLKANTTWDHVGDGGVFSTVRDLALWDANFYDNKLGGGDELLELLLGPGTLADGTPHNYAFGLMIQNIGGRPAVLHGGSWVGFTAGMVRFPEQRLSVIVLSNCQAPSDELANRVARLLLGDPK